jgi:hypothetical protein
MFVQIIEGRASDKAEMQRLMERWMAELRPGATGFLGTTAGVADDGRAIAIVRFESAEAARANSERPEQGEWWSQMEACYDGDVSFAESEDVQTMLGGGSNDAGFVQVMKSAGVDRDLIARMDDIFEQHAPTMRPDLVGGLRAWTGPDSSCEVIYFSSEAAAREGETKPMPPEFDELGIDFGEVMADTEFIDLKDPWIY